MKNFKKLSMYDENMKTTTSNSSNPLMEFNFLYKKTKNMKHLIQKYEAKLQYLTQNLEITKELMDKETLECMELVKAIVTEMVDDLKKEESNINQNS